MSPHRRAFLRRCGTAAGVAVGVAGCLGAPTSASDESETTATASSDGESTTATGTPDGESTASTGTPDASGQVTDESDAPIRWHSTLDAPVATPLTVAGDAAYLGTDDGALRALSTADGRPRWSVDLDAPVQSAPAVVGDTVVVVTGQMALSTAQEVHAYAVDDGSERWSFAPDSWWLDLVGVTDGTAFVGTYDDVVKSEDERLYALSVETGEKRWSAEIGDPRGGLVADGAVFVPAGGRLYAYEESDGSPRFRRDVVEYLHGTLAVGEGVVAYVSRTTAEGSTLFALDSETGEEVWASDEWFTTSTTLADGTLVAAGDHVGAFDPATGEVRWEVEEGGYAPRVPVRDGRIFVGGNRVRALALDDGDEAWSWSPDVSTAILIPAAAREGAVYVDAVTEPDPRHRYKFAVGAAGGEPRWTFAVDGELTDLSFGGDAVLVACDDVVYSLGES
ncbi:MAG: PQQ-binding-like beta-propeller repeat protein [Haloferacaceae archaeon]